MKRTDLEKLISLYVDGEVNEKISKQVAQLIESNQEAAEIHSSFLKIRECISKTPRISLPSDFSRTILEKVNSRKVNRRKESKVYLFCRKNRTLVCSIASVLLLLLILPLFLFQVPSSDQKNEQTLAVVPAVKTEVSEQQNAIPVLNKEETVIASAKEVSKGKRTSSFLEMPIAYAPVPKVQKVDPSTLALSVFCTLNSPKKDLFFPKFQDQSSELGLTFTTKHRNGKIILEFHLTRQNLEKLVLWLNSRSDYVSSVQISKPLENWRESNVPSDLYDSAGKDLKKTIRFELSVE